MKTITPVLIALTILFPLSVRTAERSSPSSRAPRPAKAKKPKVEHKTYLTPEEAGPDFGDQGEYLGTWGGAQVIALGEGRFRAVLYTGGLPGAGWDKSGKHKMDGQRGGDAIVFAASGGLRGEIKNGALIATLPDGAMAPFKKTERRSPTLGAKPPPGAVILFDGTGADAWVGGHMDQRQLLQAGTKTKEKFNDFTLHLEFYLPFKPTARGQDRGNSGVYLQDRYEVQVLDSFGLNGENNECGGIYSVAKPALNMCFPPLTWQTYDIAFRSARFDDTGKKTTNASARITHNGVVIHEEVKFPGSTGGGAPERPTPGAIQLQGHGNPVFFRNIWVVPE